MHSPIGADNAYNLDYTVRQSRSFDEMLAKLPRGEERDYFEKNTELRRAFPQGTFNVWGVPEDAKPPFDLTEPGDVVFFAPSVGDSDGFVQYFCVVKVVPRLRFEKASRILWMEAPQDRIYPYIFFFDVEEGALPWFNFTYDAGYTPGWNPKGWYVHLANARFLGDRNSLSYLEYIRSNYRFRKTG